MDSSSLTTSSSQDWAQRAGALAAIPQQRGLQTLDGAYMARYRAMLPSICASMQGYLAREFSEFYRRYPETIAWLVENDTVPVKDGFARSTHYLPPIVIGKGMLHEALLEYHKHGKAPKDADILAQDQTARIESAFRQIVRMHLYTCDVPFQVHKIHDGSGLAWSLNDRQMQAYVGACGVRSVHDINNLLPSQNGFSWMAGDVDGFNWLDGRYILTDQRDQHALLTMGARISATDLAALATGEHQVVQMQPKQLNTYRGPNYGERHAKPLEPPLEMGEWIKRIEARKAREARESLREGKTP